MLYLAVCSLSTWTCIQDEADIHRSRLLSIMHGVLHHNMAANICVKRLAVKVDSRYDHIHVILTYRYSLQGFWKDEMLQYIGCTIWYKSHDLGQRSSDDTSHMTQVKVHLMTSHYRHLPSGGIEHHLLCYIYIHFLVIHFTLMQRGRQKCCLVVYVTPRTCKHVCHKHT